MLLPATGDRWDHCEVLLMVSVAVTEELSVRPRSRFLVLLSRFPLPLSRTFGSPRSPSVPALTAASDGCSNTPLPVLVPHTTSAQPLDMGSIAILCSTGAS